MKYTHLKIEKEFRRYSTWGVMFGEKSPNKYRRYRLVSFIGTIVLMPILAYSKEYSSLNVFVFGIIMELAFLGPFICFMILAGKENRRHTPSLNSKKASIVKEILDIDGIHTSENMRVLGKQCLRLADVHKKKVLEWPILLSVIAIMISIFNGQTKMTENLKVDISTLLFVFIFMVFVLKIGLHLTIDWLANSKSRRFAHIALILEEFLIREERR